MADNSTPIDVLNVAPGVFGRDDPMAKWSGKGTDGATTDGFFKLDGYYTGEADPASDPLDKTIVRHIDTKEEVNMKNITGRTYTHVYGWKYLFSATAPNTSKVGGSGGGTKGKCFQLYDQQEMAFSRGFLIGSLTGHDKDHRARWTESPIGVQFQWTDKNSTRQNNGGFKLHDMWLMFMDTEFGIMQYAPICSGSDWQGDVEIIGDDPAEKFWAGDEPGTSIEQVDGQTGGAASRKAANDHNGRVIAYVKDEHVELIRKNKMMCVGFYISTLNGSQGSFYDRVWDIFSFKLLWHKKSEPCANSVKIIPPLQSFDDAMLRLGVTMANMPVT